MEKKIIGRKQELALLTETLVSNKSELVAIYGRRRVGKTFLIRENYKNNFIFEVTGLSNGSLSDQLENFTKELRIRANDMKQLHTIIHQVKSRLRSVYSWVHKEHIERLLSEFSFRINRSIYKETIFHELIERMVIANPFSYQAIKVSS